MPDVPVCLLMTVAVMPCVVGVVSLRNPRVGWNFFGMPCTAGESANMGYIFAARGMMIGSTFIILGLQNQRRLMGQLVVPWTLMVGLEIWVCARYGIQGKVWGHVIGFVVLSILGLWLLYY